MKLILHINFGHIITFHAEIHVDDVMEWAKTHSHQQNIAFLRYSNPLPSV